MDDEKKPEAAITRSIRLRPDTFAKINEMVGEEGRPGKRTQEDVIGEAISVYEVTHLESNFEVGAQMKQALRLGTRITEIFNGIVKHSNTTLEIREKDFANERSEYLNQIAAWSTKNDELNTLLQDNAKEINRITGEMEKLQKESEAAENRATTAESNNLVQQKLIVEKDEKIADRNEKLAQKDAEIDEIKKELAEVNTLKQRNMDLEASVKELEDSAEKSRERYETVIKTKETECEMAMKEKELEHREDIIAREQVLIQKITELNEAHAKKLSDEIDKRSNLESEYNRRIEEATNKQAKTVKRAVNKPADKRHKL